MSLRALSVALLVSCLAVAAHAVPALEDNDLELELVIGDLDLPTAMAFIGPNDFFVLEKNDGQVYRVLNGAKTIALDLHVNYCEERGLLGIAVHPDFATANPKYVYLYYTESAVADDQEGCAATVVNNLDRFEWNGMNLVNRANLAEFPSFVTYHNGGPLGFGMDGKLYGVTGDNEEDGPAQNNELSSTFDDTGVIFRLNDDGTSPTDGPFDDDDDGLDPEDAYFAIGIRNSFGLTWDPNTGVLWDTENGANIYDEINRVAPGFNSGWRDVMGPASETPAFDPDTDLTDLAGAEYADPAYSIQVPVAPTGLAFASMSTTLGEVYEGDLFVGDYERGQVYDFDVNAMRDGLATTDKIANSPGELDDFLFASGFTNGIADLEEGPDGGLYVVGLGLGEIWRISGSGAQQMHDLAFTGLKPPKKVAFTPNPPVAKALKLSLQNVGTAVETIVNQAALDSMLGINFIRLGNQTCPAPAVNRVLSKGTFPYAWEPGKKLSIGLELTWNNCFNDPLATTKTEDHDDFTLDASVDLSALGETDGDAGNDACPRAATGDDKGCGKMSTPFRIDLYLK